MIALSTLLIGLLLAPASPAQEDDFGPLLDLIAESDESQTQLDLLQGIREGLQGRRRVELPTAWPSVFAKVVRSPDPRVREEATSIGLIFGDPKATATLVGLAKDAKADRSVRSRAIRDLAQAQAGGLSPLLIGLLADPIVRTDALRALGTVDDPEVPRVILDLYPKLSPADRAEALSALATRKSSAKALVAAIESKAIPTSDVSASHVQALLALDDKGLVERVAKAWGVVRPTPDDRKKTIEAYRARLDPAGLKGADLGHGRSVFQKVCSNCHKLFDDGGAIGPELTGSQRNNLDYVLSNVLDPNAAVGRDYQVNVFEMEDGRTLSGIIKLEDDRSVTLRTLNDLLVLPKGEISGRRGSNLSMMPEGLLQNLKDDEVRDLVAYLGSPGQVPLPATASARP